LYFDGKQNVHGSTGEVDNPVFGFLEEIGVSYGGFSGWSRICFVILQGEASVDSTDLGSGMEAAEWVHCYEALIIPSGRMMLGRWVDLKDQSGRGPFIFWDV
jgi:hypothetical protein